MESRAQVHKSAADDRRRVRQREALALLEQLFDSEVDGVTLSFSQHKGRLNGELRFSGSPEDILSNLRSFVQ
jgi:hypothetical protein